ncbi:hypothetical protein [Methylorubrum aminovorans]
MPLDNAPLHLVIRDYIELKTEETVEIVEANEKGAGRAVFEIKGNALLIRHFRDKPPLKWSKNQKCADGAILIEDGITNSLHVVELKKTVSEKKWPDIREQYEGMIHNVLAILAVLDIKRPKTITCHIAFETDKMPILSSTNPVLLKFPVGEARPIGGALDWANSRITLSSFGGVKLQKIQRGAGSVGIGDIA